MQDKAEQLHKNNNTQGYLRRTGKAGKSTLGLRRKRFYKLDGAILSKHLNEDSEVIWDVNVREAEAVQLGKLNFVLSLSREEKGTAAKDFDQNAIILYARTEEECRKWVASLRYAAHRKLENHYELGRQIGEGGFAKVHLGRCTLTGELRAIKTMQKSNAYAKLFGTEIAIIKRVSHPNIVKTLDVYETRSEFHIVMEYMEGGMLYEAIEDGVRFNEDDVAQFMSELLDGVLYLHKIGIVHRDMKPENVLCTSREVPLHVKIADFGLSSITNLAELKANQMLMSTMIGTPEFIAPEIARKEEYTEKVDIWALGMLCYNVICGKLPLDEKQDLMPQIRYGVKLSFAEEEWQNYSEVSKSFLRALLCSDTDKRPTALACLVHPWLDGRKLGESQAVAQHGRVSKYLVDRVPSRVASPSEKHGKHAERKSPSEVKRLWVIAYLTVSAALRFDWLVHRNRFDRAQRELKELRSKQKRQSISTETSEISQSLPVRDRRRSGGEASEKEDECSTSQTFGSETICEGKHTGGSVPSTPRSTSLTGQGSGSKSELRTARKVGSWRTIAQGLDRPKKVSSWGEGHPSDETKKPSFRDRFLAGIVGEHGNRQAPVRKLSRKLLKKADDKKGNPSSTAESESLNLELSFDDLNLQEVDEGEVVLVETMEASPSPATPTSKKNRFGLKKQKDTKLTEISPVTPRKDF